MPQNAPIVIKDGAATPADHTFAPINVDGNVASYKERAGTTAIGWPQLSVSLREPAKGGVGTYKVQVKLTQPKVLTTTDSTGKQVTSVDYTNLAVVDLVISASSTKQERVDIRTLLMNALKSATVISVVDDLEFIW